MVEVGSLVLFNWIKGSEEPTNSLANVIQECKEWHKRGWMVNVIHVLREGNFVANKLTKLAFKSLIVGISQDGFTRWRRLID